MGKTIDGPWRVDPDLRDGMEYNNHIVLEADGSMCICFMAHSGTEDNSEMEAAAALIAAAPDLLKSLKETVKMLEAAYRQLGMYSADNTRIAAARAAIDKAGA